MTDLEEKLQASVIDLQKRKRKEEAAGVQHTALVVHRDVSGPLEFSPAQRQMIRDTYAAGASESEFQVLLETAKIRRLNPLLRQIHFLQRWNPDLERKVWVSVVGIDGFRAIADRTKLYGGQDEPEFGPLRDGFPEWCKVRVYRKDWQRPGVGVAFWKEYVQLKRDGKPTRSWAVMAHVMIAKCAEAQAMRKAFPEDLGGLYLEEEMQRAEFDLPQIAPSIMPGDDPDQPPQENEALSLVFEQLEKIEQQLKTTGSVTWNDLVAIRAIMGARGGTPTEMSKTMSELNLGDAISPGQKKELGKLWNRIDRQVKRYEGITKAPSPEQSFDDGEPEPGSNG